MNTQIIYNGKTLAQIQNNFPAAMITSHKEEYLNNIKEVAECERTGYNLDKANQLRYRNFIIINYYNTIA